MVACTSAAKRSRANPVRVSFYPSITDSNSGISSTLPGTGRAARPLVVPAITLDELARQVGRSMDLLKIDVEGAEDAVFEGGRSVLGAAQGPAIIFESFGVEPQLERLGALGYSVRRLHYTLATGLELRAPLERFDHISAAYEAPNYFAAKDPATFEALIGRANERRSASLRLLGRL